MAGSRSLGTLTIDLVAKIGGFTSGMDKAARHSDKRMREIHKQAKALGRDIGLALSAVGTAAAAGLGIYIRNTIEAEKVQAQLEARIKSTGSAAGLTIVDLNDMADALQRVTTFDDEGIGEVQSMLLTFTKITADTFGDATEAVLNLSTAMNQGLKESAIQVGKALNDPILGVTALRRVGIQLAKDQEELIRKLVETGDVAGAQKIILAELETQMGGSARAARDTLGGALTGLKNNFDNLLEGDTSEGGLKGTVDAINNLSDALTDPDLKDGIDTLVNGLVQAANAAVTAAGKLGGFISKYREWLTEQGFNPDLDDQTLEQLEERRKGIQQALAAPGMLGAARRGIFGEDLLQHLSEVEAAIKRIKEAEVTLITGTSGSIRDADRRPVPTGTAPTGGGAPDPVATAIGDRVDASRDLEKAMRDQQRAEEDLFKHSLAVLDVTNGATIAWAELEAQLNGPLAQAELDHINRLHEIEMAGIRAGVSSEEIARAKALETEAYRQTTAAMQEQMDAMANPRLVDAMDAARFSMLDFFRDIREGEGVLDSLTRMLDRFADALFDLAAQGLIDQLMGKPGTTGGGTSGGNWLSGILSMFGFGGGRASGGGVDAGTLYRVNEEGPELLSVSGKDYLMMGAAGGMVTPNHRLGAAGGFNQTVNFHLGAPTDPRTQTQIAAKVAYETNRAASRNR